MSKVATGATNALILVIFKKKCAPSASVDTPRASTIVRDSKSSKRPSTNIQKIDRKTDNVPTINSKSESLDPAPTPFDSTFKACKLRMEATAKFSKPRWPVITSKFKPEPFSSARGVSCLLSNRDLPSLAFPHQSSYNTFYTYGMIAGSNSHICYRYKTSII